MGAHSAESAASSSGLGSAATTAACRTLATAAHRHIEQLVEIHTGAGELAEGPLLFSVPLPPPCGIFGRDHPLLLVFERHFCWVYNFRFRGIFSPQYFKDTAPLS